MPKVRHDAITDEERELAARCKTYEEYEQSGGKRSRSSWRDIRFVLKKQAIAEANERASPVPLPAKDDLDIEDYYAAVKRVTAVQIERQDKPTEVRWTAPDDNYVGLVFVGDIHVGGLIDYDRLERDLAIIRDNEGLHAVGMGDYADHFESAGKLQHAMAGNTVPGTDDQDQLVQHIMGMVGRKWIAVLAGNHDDWSGPSSVQRLARHLGAQYVSQGGCSLKITVGGERYVGYAKHTWRGHSSISTSNESRRFWLEWNDFENADFTVLAHFHQPDTHQVERKGQTVGHIRGGTYKVVDSHSARLGFDPGYGPGMVILNPFAHEVIPFHGPNWLRGVQMLQWLRSKPRDKTDLLMFGDGQ